MVFLKSWGSAVVTTGSPKLSRPPFTSCWKATHQLIRLTMAFFGQNGEMQKQKTYIGGYPATKTGDSHPQTVGTGDPPRKNTWDRVRIFLGNCFFLVLGILFFFGRGHGFLTFSLFSMTFPWFFIGFPSFFLTFSSFSSIFLWFFIIVLSFSSFSITFPWFFIMFLTFSSFSIIFS